MSLYIEDEAETRDIIRMFNTNINGRTTIVEALTIIRGIGRRMSALLCKRAGIDTSLRAGEVEQEKYDKIAAILENPQAYDIPEWFLNHSRDIIDGKSSHLISNQIEANIRLYLEKAKRIKHVRGQRLLRGLKVNGQRTKSNGRRGKTVGVSKKK